MSRRRAPHPVLARALPIPLPPSLGSSLLPSSPGTVPTNFRPPSGPVTLWKSVGVTWTLSRPTRFRLRLSSPVLVAEMACSSALAIPSLVVGRGVLTPEGPGVATAFSPRWVRLLELDLIRLDLAWALSVGVPAEAEAVPVEGPEIQTTTNSCLLGWCAVKPIHRFSANGHHCVRMICSCSMEAVG